MELKYWIIPFTNWKEKYHISQLSTDEKCVFSLKRYVMQNFIYPLTLEEFESLHREAWHNGWTYGPAFPELYEDYLVNWVYFVDYVDVLINARNNSHKRQYERTGADIVHIPLENGQVLLRHVPDAYKDAFNPLSNVEAEMLVTKNAPLKIFIGEAPPKWKWKELTSNRTYFYHPFFTKKSDWLEVPKNIFNVSNPNKPEDLIELATKQFLLLDIFPFPIIQDTEIRKEVTGEFGAWLELYFIGYFTKCINYIEQHVGNIKKEYALAMPLYGSLQICFGETSRDVIKKEIDDKFYSKPIDELKNEVHEKWEIRLANDGEKQGNNTTILAGDKKDRYNFILGINPSINNYNLSELNDKFANDYLVNIPMLTTGKNSLSSSEFINSKTKNE
jgi:hypothetical protein